MKHRLTSKQRLLRLAMAGVLTAVAMIFSWIEFMLPFSVGIPGVKLGLCHIVTLLAIYRLTPWETITVTGIRVALTAVLFGSVATLAYSAAGAAVSLSVMLLLRRLTRNGRPLFSPIGISMAGAVTHNLAQLVTAALSVQTIGILSYLPVLLIAGTVTGAIVGIVAAIVQKKL